ncbi:piggyBac transposable element-derived protein 4 [Anoplophora glabripennis]|uniref:piggyBac transposable element-derived protein 4 n=1 Tax=Anoplophora glabripennis TaxID=217634 RepID=UPI000C76DEAF|nr:piggyBac transposable element-derived protein 4 [Anoplophora glabripennis]
MPKLEGKLKKRETASRSSDICLVTKWKDRRDVTMITTMHENKIVTLDKIDRATNENVKKSLCVVDYNEKMGAVDRSDMMMSSIDSLRKSMKWYKKLFVHTLDICVLNAHGMFSTKHHMKYPLAKFQMDLIRQLLERYGQVNKPTPMSAATTSKLTERHFPFLVPAAEKSKNASRRCTVCFQTKLRQKKRSTSRYMCKECNVGLCVFPCFQEFHTKVIF